MVACSTMHQEKRLERDHVDRLWPFNSIHTRDRVLPATGPELKFLYACINREIPRLEEEPCKRALQNQRCRPQAPLGEAQPEMPGCFCQEHPQRAPGPESATQVHGVPVKEVKAFQPLGVGLRQNVQLAGGTPHMN